MASTYKDFIQEGSSALIAAGLTPAADPRQNSLSTASRGNFDGSFLIRNEQGGEPWPEASLVPRHWKGNLTIEVATDVATSLQEADVLVEDRAAKVYKAIFFVNFAHGRFYQWSTPRKTRDLDNKRIVWSVEIRARWVHDV